MAWADSDSPFSKTILAGSEKRLLPQYAEDDDFLKVLTSSPMSASEKLKHVPTEEEFENMRVPLKYYRLAEAFKYGKYQEDNPLKLASTARKFYRRHFHQPDITFHALHDPDSVDSVPRLTLSDYKIYGRDYKDFCKYLKDNRADFSRMKEITYDFENDINIAIERIYNWYPPKAHEIFDQCQLYGFDALPEDAKHLMWKYINIEEEMIPTIKLPLKVRKALRIMYKIRRKAADRIAAYFEKGINPDEIPESNDKRILDYCVNDIGDIKPYEPTELEITALKLLRHDNPDLIMVYLIEDYFKKGYEPDDLPPELKLLFTLEKDLAYGVNMSEIPEASEIALGHGGASLIGTQSVITPKELSTLNAIEPDVTPKELSILSAIEPDVTPKEHSILSAIEPDVTPAKLANLSGTNRHTTPKKRTSISRTKPDIIPKKFTTLSAIEPDIAPQKKKKTVVVLQKLCFWRKSGKYVLNP